MTIFGPNFLKKVLEFSIIIFGYELCHCCAPCWVNFRVARGKLFSCSLNLGCHSPNIPPPPLGLYLKRQRLRLLLCTFGLIVCGLVAGEVPEQVTHPGLGPPGHPGGAPGRSPQRGGGGRRRSGLEGGRFEVGQPRAGGRAFEEGA